MAQSMVVGGRCLCGAVRYELTGTPIGVQLESTLHVPFVVFQMDWARTAAGHNVARRISGTVITRGGSLGWSCAVSKRSFPWKTMKTNRNM